MGVAGGKNPSKAQESEHEDSVFLRPWSVQARGSFQRSRVPGCPHLQLELDDRARPAQHSARGALAITDVAVSRRAHARGRTAEAACLLEEMQHK